MTFPRWNKLFSQRHTELTICGASLEHACTPLLRCLIVVARKYEQDELQRCDRRTCKRKSETTLFGHWKVYVASRALNNVDRCRLIGMVLIGGQPRVAFVSLMRRRIISDISRALYRFARNTLPGDYVFISESLPR